VETTGTSPPAPQPEGTQPRWCGPQRRIGLTGGIATGKSAVGRLLAERELPLLDADAFAWDALAPGSPASLTVLARHGARVRAAGETIDRAALGRIVFHDAAERHWLEQLLHPVVRARFESELQRLSQEQVVVLMIPLLFEAGLEGLCSEIWVVGCTDAQQRQRLMARNGLSTEDADARINSQWPQARKKALADVWIDNRQGLDQLERVVSEALGQGIATATSEISGPGA